MRKTILTLDPVKLEPVIREMTPEERPLQNFGEDIGLLIFQPWYYCIPTKGHVSYAKSYDYPVRLKFVEDPFDSVGFHESDQASKGWNIDAWIQAAKEIQEEGVRAIVCGCGLTGMIQKELQAAVEIPLYSSTMLFVPEVHKTIADGKRVGILTVSSAQLTAHNGAIFEGCDIDRSIPIAIAGMNESEYGDIWAKQATSEFCQQETEAALVSVALKLQLDFPDIGALVFECTEMPPYKEAVAAATGLPVFSPIDMINRVQEQVSD